ncbi:MAG: mechanosensitive ion channel [Gemmatimonadota bacterium]
MRRVVQYLPVAGIIVVLLAVGEQCTIEAWISTLGLPGMILSVVLLAAGSAWAIHLLWTRLGLARGGEFTLQAWVLIVIPLLAVVVVVLGLPESETKQNLINGLAVVIAAVFTLSSTTFASNAISGVMLRSVRTFRSGDWLQAGDQLGRVTQRGLLHTEIVTADRNLTTIPNRHLITHPYTVVPSSGTVVSAPVSLGYEVPAWTVEPIREEAAAAIGLEVPFTQVVELGDVTVTYRAGGVLRQVRSLLTARSKLRRQILVGLHSAGIEIMSPSVVGHRSIPPDRLLIPGDAQVDDLPESVIFEKADAVEKAEEGRSTVAKLQSELEQLRMELGAADPADGVRLTNRMQTLENRLERARRVLAEREKREEDLNSPEGG